MRVQEVRVGLGTTTSSPDDIQHSRNTLANICTLNLPTKIILIKIPSFKLSGKFLMGLGIAQFHHLKRRFCFSQTL